MSGQKYKRTNFDDDDNTSTGGTPPGVNYDPAIAFKAGATFWQRRTLLERLLLVLCVILALVAIILGALLGAHNHPSLPTADRQEAPSTVQSTSGPTKQPVTSTQQPDQKLCLTKACVTVASSILNAMDDTVDPCDDFYEYSCRNWVRAHPIPSGSSRWGTFAAIWKENQIIMKNAIEKPMEEMKSEAEAKAKRYYTTCMDPNKTLDDLGAQPLLDLLAEYGGWNVSSSSGVWNSSEWSFQKTIEDIQKLGMSTMFASWVSEDEKTVDKVHIIQFDQGGISLVRDQYLNKSIEDDKVLSAYWKYMWTVGELLGGEHNHTKNLMLKVIEFEQSLAEITTPQEDRRDNSKLYNKMKLSELQALAPFIDWVSYSNAMVESAGLSVNSSEHVLVYAADYLQQLSNLTTQMLSTEEGKTVLHTYLIWRVVKPTSVYLSKPFVDAKTEFLRVLSGVTGEVEPWRYCISDTESVLGFALSAMFVREAFKGNRKEKAEEMIAQIKAAFKANLPNLKWMDDATRKAAIEKADAVKDMIGFPSYLLNATAMDEKYKDLEVTDEYFMNNIRFSKYTLLKNTELLHQVPEKESWSMTPVTVNAYYTPVKNEIVFPAGILQAPYYDRDYPKSLNFGAMGVVMGHELTHGFDDQGREYNKDGVLEQWWNDESVRKFKERAACMAEQYSQYTINGDKIRGNQTLGENIADNGGLKAAFNAYEAWVSENGEESPLPGLDFTHKQLFFIAFAQVWCTNSKPEADHMSILTDPHSPPKFRVIGTLSNFKEFANQFQCREGTRMNPKDKCVVW